MCYTKITNFRILNTGNYCVGGVLEASCHCTEGSPALGGAEERSSWQLLPESMWITLLLSAQGNILCRWEFHRAWRAMENLPPTIIRHSCCLQRILLRKNITTYSDRVIKTPCSKMGKKILYIPPCGHLVPTHRDIFMLWKLRIALNTLRFSSLDSPESILSFRIPSLYYNSLFSG